MHVLLYKLEPAHSYSTGIINWDAMFISTEAILRSVCDIDRHLLLELDIGGRVKENLKIRQSNANNT